MIVLDDTGFAHLGCYGSTIETPNIDRLAAKGLRYTNFHATALCSPSRACFLTGRNHHSVGMRGVSNWDSGFPHMRGAITPAAATLPELLREHGYATYCAGKWHLAPMRECSAAGPHTNWPLQKGFDRFYGFLQGETDQYYPELTEDNHHIGPPKRPEDGYHLSEDLVDTSIGWLRDLTSVRPIARSFSTCRSAQRMRPTSPRENSARSIVAVSTKAGTRSERNGLRANWKRESCRSAPRSRPATPAYFAGRTSATTGGSSLLVSRKRLPLSSTIRTPRSGGSSSSWKHRVS